MNAMLFNYIGALQRDAPPSAVKGEPLAAPPKAYDVQVSSRGKWCCCAAAFRGCMVETDKETAAGLQ